MEDEEEGATGGGCTCPSCGAKLKVVAEDEAAERRKTAVQNVKKLLRPGGSQMPPASPMQEARY